MAGQVRIRVVAGMLCLAVAATGCGGAAARIPSDLPDSDAGRTSTAGATLFDSSVVHDIGIVFEPDDYDEMVAAFAESGTKEWIEAQVTIDGATYERAGIRLKGNSSLMGLRAGRAGGPAGDAGADEPESLPWLIRLDKWVEGQDHEGIVDLVVRSNVSETALNEAVAVELLGMAGLASQDAIAVRFSANGSPDVLRLVIEHPDDVWMAEEFSAGGALFKAESTGDYTYRGEDPDAYDEVFDQEAGEQNADLSPLIEFLAFINESDDATFAAELADHLDVDAFATYLAMQELIDNFDDIDGPGNNSYLYYDPAAERFTVVPWDHNLAFGLMGNGGRFPGGPEGDPDAGGLPVAPGQLPGERPDGEFGRPPPDFEGGPPGAGFDRNPPGEPGDPGDRGGSNVLSERFLAENAFAALYEQRLEELRTSLFASGAAADILDAWVVVLTDQASDLIDPGTVQAEADLITAAIDAA